MIQTIVLPRQIRYNIFTMRGEHPPIHEIEPQPFKSLEHWLGHDFPRQYSNEVGIMNKTGEL